MFNTEGVFLPVRLPRMPRLNAAVSAKANSGLWQLAQLIVESLESIFSKNNFRPRSAVVFTFSIAGVKEKFAAIKTESNNIVAEKNLFMHCKNTNPAFSTQNFLPIRL